MQQPTDINRKLLCFGTGEQHAVIESMQESLFTDPSPSVHQFAVHDRDLPCRSAERYKTQLHPEAKRLSESNGSSSSFGITCCRSIDFVCPLDDLFSNCHCCPCLMGRVSSAL